MKTFHFLAKQGQHHQIARLLAARFGKPRIAQTPNGIQITLALPNDVSKRSVERYLYANNVPGAHSQRNRFKILKGGNYVSSYDFLDKVGYNTVFIISQKGKLRKAKIVQAGTGCTCCGYWPELRFI